MADDYSADLATTGVVVAGGVTLGEIEAQDDRDWFRVTLQGGHGYLIDLRGLSSGAGSLEYPLLRLRDALGNPVASIDGDSGFGRDSQLAVRPAADGMYFIEAGAFTVYTGTYAVSLTDLGAGTARFQAPALKLASYGTASGWTSQDAYPRFFGDLAGLDTQDIVGFGAAGVFTSLATGSGYTAPVLALAAFGAAGGWTSQDAYPRLLGRVNGLTTAGGGDDIIAFGAAGVYSALGQFGSSFAAPTFELAAFGANQGWTSQDLYPRLIADVNPEGRSTIVGFGAAGVFQSLPTGPDGFAAPTFELAAFGASQGWTSQDKYPRFLADVTGTPGDAREDIVGFGADGVYVSRGLPGPGFGFAAPTLALSAFGTNQGWSSQEDYPRFVRDINGDRLADIVGIGSDAVYYALATGGGAFGPVIADANIFGFAGGWTNNDTFPRDLAEATGDLRADLVGFGSAGVYVGQSVDFWGV